MSLVDRDPSDESDDRNSVQAERWLRELRDVRDPAWSQVEAPRALALSLLLICLVYVLVGFAAGYALGRFT